ncbi:hypothetical protein GCM10027056_13340 [Glaciibacter psychrotolerans]
MTGEYPCTGQDQRGVDELGAAGGADAPARPTMVAATTNDRMIRDVLMRTSVPKG